MQRDRTKWRADRGARALKSIDEIQTSIAALDDDDLLDLHDIFRGPSRTTLGEMASAEMQKRNLVP